MKKEFNLSEKREQLLKEMLIPCETDEEKAVIIATFDFIANQDKEFIKKLKHEGQIKCWGYFDDIIEKLAGDELI